MPLRKSLRRWLSGWLVLAILFTQVATAAYACPMATAALGQGTAAMAAMPCAEMMPGGGATALDLEQPGLCMHHCQDGSLALDQTNPESVPAPALLPALTVRMPDPAGLASPTWAARQRIRERAPPLPHSIDHCCYRI
jgi:hypothetical protein